MDQLLSTFTYAQTAVSAGGGAAAAAGDAAAVAGGAAQAVPQGSPMQPLIIMGVMIVVFYFLLIRPQQKRAKKHKEMIGALKRGDTVITSSGIKGRISAINGNWVELEIAPKTKIQVLKPYVGGTADEKTEGELVTQAGQA